MNQRTIAFCLLAWLSASVVFAAEGRIPIYSTTGVFDINAASGDSGSYYLAGNFDGRIIVWISHVTIDMNGFTLNVPDGQQGITFGSGSSVTDVTVKNGKIHGGTDGIYFRNDAIPSEFIIEDVVLVGQTQRGIYLIGYNENYVRAILRRNVSYGATYPMYFRNLRGSLIENNEARGGGSAGATFYLWDSSSNTIRDNVFTEAINFGIYMSNSSNNLIVGNTVGGAYGLGGDTSRTEVGISMALCSGNTVANNNASNNSHNGIEVWGNNNNIHHNTCSNIGYDTSPYGSGIFITTGSGNTIDWNQLSGERGIKGYGIRFDTDTATGNVYSFNRAYGNSAGAYSQSCQPSCNTNVSGTNFP